MGEFFLFFILILPGRRPRGRPRRLWKVYIGVPGERKAWVSLLRNKSSYKLKKNVKK